MANPMQAMRNLFTAAWHRNSGAKIFLGAYGRHAQLQNTHLTVVGSGSNWFGNKSIHMWGSGGFIDQKLVILETIRVTVAKNHIEKNHYVLECVISVVAYLSFYILGMSLVGVSAAFMPVFCVVVASMLAAWALSSGVGVFFEGQELQNALINLSSEDCALFWDQEAEICKKNSQFEQNSSSIDSLSEVFCNHSFSARAVYRLAKVLRMMVSHLQEAKA